MKKIKALILVVLLLIPYNVNALSASVRCSAPSSVTVGQTFNVTISASADIQTYWNGSAINSSSNLRSNSGTGTFVEQNATSSVSKTYSFTALSEGTATVSQTFNVSDENYNEKSYTSNTCTISIVKPVENTSKPQTSNSNNSQNNKTTTQNNNTNLSSDNSLKSLSIEGAYIDPEFNKDTLEYNVELQADTKTIKINVEKSDENATISGDGEVSVNEGKNVLQIVVTAQNGATRTYTINAIVKEHDPITVNVDNEKYTVLKKISDIEAPTGFEKKTITISKNEVDCFYSEKLNYTLVALQDKIGNIKLYIYDSKADDYSKYSPIVSEKLNIIVLRAKESEIPHRYVKSKFKYDGQEITGYTLSESSDFRLIYAINVETGEKGFYLYDIKGKTLQRFYNEQVNIYVELMQKCKFAFAVLGGFILFLTIVIIILLSRNVKFKKKYLERRLSPIDNPIIEEKNTEDIKYHSLDETEKIDIEDIPKQKKKKNKKEKTFLDE